jgi:hypothetical protein
VKFFELYELVDPTTYSQLGQEAWGLFHLEALLALDDFRQFFGVPVLINNWHSGGEFQWRGYRTPEEAAKLGAPNSQHRFGNAFDCDIQGISAEHARAAIIASKDDPLLRRIMRLEQGVSWVHFDLLSVPDRIHLFHK